MTGHCIHGKRNRRQGFTLLEVLLTLGLLVIMSALAWVSLEKPFAGMRLRKAADQIRAEWRTARVEAMETGEIHAFRYAPEENTFRVESCSALQGQQDVALGNGLNDSPTGSGGLPTAGQPVEGTLPEGVTFVLGETAQDTRAATVATAADQSGLLPTGFSEPILFYPDGTTSTARLVLKNGYDRYVELQLRGLTGIVSVGEVRGTEEALQ